MKKIIAICMICRKDATKGITPILVYLQQDTAARHLGFGPRLDVTEPEVADDHYALHTKIGVNRTIGGRDMAIFVFQDGGLPLSWILSEAGYDVAGSCGRPNATHKTKFGEGQVTGGRVIAIFRF